MPRYLKESAQRGEAQARQRAALREVKPLLNFTFGIVNAEGPSIGGLEGWSNAKEVQAN